MNKFFVRHYETHSESWWLAETDVQERAHYLEGRDGSWWYMQHNFHHTKEGADAMGDELCEYLAKLNDTVEVIRL